MSAPVFTPDWYCVACGCSGTNSDESGNGCGCDLCHPENRPPVDYRYTRCPDCRGLGTNPDACQILGCRPHADAPNGNGHEHLCGTCRGADHNPQGQTPVDYQYTLCPTCGGDGRHPHPPCDGMGGTCPVSADPYHWHTCPTCQGVRHDPDWYLQKAADRIYLHGVAAAKARQPKPARRRLFRRGGTR